MLLLKSFIVNEMISFIEVICIYTHEKGLSPSYVQIIYLNLWLFFKLIENERT